LRIVPETFFAWVANPEMNKLPDTMDRSGIAIARVLYRLNALLLVGFFLVSIAAWGHVPERVPLHFSFAGDPDIWVAKSIVSWLGLPALAVAIAAFFYGLHRAGRPYPKTWDVPEKEEFLRLPPGGQAAVWEIMDQTVAGTMLLTTVLFMGAQAAVYLVATGRADGIPWYIAILEVAVIAGVVVLAFVYKRRVRRYIRSRRRTLGDESEVPPPGSSHSLG
jgi:uncharacterized integral membrane protein